MAFSVSGAITCYSCLGNAANSYCEGKTYDSFDYCDGYCLKIAVQYDGDEDLPIGELLR